jgi:aminoglycoside 3-N-acetyltransferase
LRALGLGEGGTVLVHASLRSLGWVVGGAQAMILALTQTLGETGTLVMPAYSTDNSEPRDWNAPLVPEAWWQTVRDHTPGFDPRQTQTREMGQIAETFRSWPGVRRSSHPATSFCAWGRLADVITQRHSLENGFGEDSPLARLYDAEGQVLLLGVGHDRNSSLHLAEHRSDWPGKRNIEQGAAMLIDGQRTWVRFTDLWSESGDFGRIGASFDATGVTRTGKIGSAPSKLMSQTALVDFGVKWIRENRR